MGELKNTFSWSFSAAKDFETCPRKRYWSKYRMWNGWNADADPECRAAYRLNKMSSRHTLKGVAVEDSIMWVLRRRQMGQEVTMNDAYEQIARPLLNGAWQDSRQQRWKQNAKKFTCLHEHYYPQFLPDSQQDWPKRIALEVKQCITNFIDQVLPRLMDIRADQEVPVCTVQMGDPESFEFDGIKVYAIPDYVYRDGDLLHIHDWKAGRPMDSHASQLAVYGLWAGIRHGVRPENIETHLEYLMTGQTASARLREEDVAEISQHIRSTAADMAEYLENADREANVPVGREEWDMAAERSVCSRCNFYELCAPELAELGL